MRNVYSFAHTLGYAILAGAAIWALIQFAP